MPCNSFPTIIKVRPTISPTSQSAVHALPLHSEKYLGAQEVQAACAQETPAILSQSQLSKGLRRRTWPPIAAKRTNRAGELQAFLGKRQLPGHPDRLKRRLRRHRFR